MVTGVNMGDEEVLSRLSVMERNGCGESVHQKEGGALGDVQHCAKVLGR